MAAQLVDIDPSPAVWRGQNKVWKTLGLWIPASLFVAIGLICFLGPIVVHLPGPSSGSLLQTLLPVGSPGHILGTDELGNDLLSRSLAGGRTSIEIGFASVALGLLIGGTVGIIAGYWRGALDVVIMRILDIFLAFPALILAMTIAAYLGPNERDVIIAISVYTTPAFARLARSATLKLREREFIGAATLIGVRHWKILTKHVVPNIFAQMTTFGLLTVGTAMLIEAALDYLGLGVRPPAPTWGTMISAGQSYLSIDPTMVLVPMIFLLLTILSANMTGEALRIRWARQW